MERHKLTWYRSGGIYQATFPNGDVYNFDRDGKLVAIKESSGKSTTIQRRSGQTTVTEEASGKRLVLNYNQDGRLTSVVDDGGRTTSFQYVGDDLTSITNPVGDAIRYGYDEEHHIVSVTGEGGEERVGNEYDDSGRVTKQWDAEGHESTFEYTENEDGRLIRVTDRNGEVTEFATDETGRLTATSSGTRTTPTATKPR